MCVRVGGVGRERDWASSAHLSADCCDAIVHGRACVADARPLQCPSFTASRPQLCACWSGNHCGSGFLTFTEEVQERFREFYLPNSLVLTAAGAPGTGRQQTGAGQIASSRGDAKSAGVKDGSSSGEGLGKGICRGWFRSSLLQSRGSTACRKSRVCFKSGKNSEL